MKIFGNRPAVCPALLQTTIDHVYNIWIEFTWTKLWYEYPECGKKIKKLTVYHIEESL